MRKNKEKETPVVTYPEPKTLMQKARATLLDREDMSNLFAVSLAADFVSHATHAVFKSAKSNKYVRSWDLAVTLIVLLLVVDDATDNRIMYPGTED